VPKVTFHQGRCSPRVLGRNLVQIRLAGLSILQLICGLCSRRSGGLRRGIWPLLTDLQHSWTSAALQHDLGP
jgi:hypothetical protein